MTSKVTVRSIAEARFTQAIEAGSHTLIADEPKSAGGADQGPGPYEFLLSALGA